jgi:uncharacterized protein
MDAFCDEQPYIVPGDWRVTDCTLSDGQVDDFEMARKPEKPPSTGLGYRYSSPDVPLSAIRRFAKRIASRFDPDKIILFGSYAYGHPHEGSDVDLLVVMPAYDETNQAIRITNALEAPFSLDLIVRTPEALKRDWQDGDWFLREVLAKGKIIHEKAHRPWGSQGRRRLARRKKPGAGQTLTE